MAKKKVIHLKYSTWPSDYSTMCNIQMRDRSQYTFKFDEVTCKNCKAAMIYNEYDEEYTDYDINLGYYEHCLDYARWLRRNTFGDAHIISLEDNS